MKILLLSIKVPYPPRDGAAVAVLNMIQGFSGLGYSVDLLSLNTQKHFADSANIAHLEQYCKTHIIPTNTRIRIIKLLSNLVFKSLPYHIDRFQTIDFRDHLIRLLEENDYDLIQIESIYLATYIEHIRKITSTPIAIRTHNIENRIIEQRSKNESNLIKKLFLKVEFLKMKQFELEILNKADFLVPISSLDLNYFRSKGIRIKSQLIPSGYSVENKKKSKKKNSQLCTSVPLLYNKIHFLGSLDWFPNQEGVLWFLENCWNQIVTNNPKAQFHIAGRNPSQTFRAKAVGENVTFHGEIENASEYIQQANIVIVPLFSGSGMRVKIIEAMALGKAIVCTSKAAEGIEYTPNENVLIANTDQEFIQAVNSLLNDSERCILLGQNAKQMILDHYDNRILMKKLDAFYSSELK